MNGLLFLPNMLVPDSINASNMQSCLQVSIAHSHIFYKQLVELILSHEKDPREKQVMTNLGTQNVQRTHSVPGGMWNRRHLFD